MVADGLVDGYLAEIPSWAKAVLDPLVDSCWYLLSSGTLIELGRGSVF